MIPARHVVAHPVRCIALNAGAAGATQHEGSQLGHCLQESLGCTHSHQHRVLVVKALVRKLSAVKAHSHWIDFAGGWLIHVIPNAGQAALDMLGVQLTPPGTRFLVSKVGERGVARPNLTDVCVTALGDCEHLILEAVVINLVARVLLHTGVNDGDHAHALRLQTLEHCWRVRVALFIPGENSVAIHVIDVEPEGVERHIHFAILGNQALHVALVVTKPAALVKTE